MKTSFLSLLGTALLLALTATPTAQVGAGNQKRTQLDGLTPRTRFQQGIELLEALEKPRDLALQRELGALLESAPELQGRIPDLLRNRAVSTKTSDVLIFLLERIGSPGTQAELALLQADPTLRHLDRLRAIMALGTQGDADPAAVASLWTTSATRLDTRSVDLSNTALLALGSIGNDLRQRQSPRFAEIREGLLLRLASATVAPEVAMVLKAVGNLNDVSLGNHVEPYAFERSAPVRATAWQTLGRLGDVSKRPVLVERLPSERIGSVRAIMTQALRDMGPDTDALHLVHTILRNERHTEARALMAKFLVDNLATYDDSLETLKDMALTDPDGRVRMIAGDALVW